MKRYLWLLLSVACVSAGVAVVIVLSFGGSGNDVSQPASNPADIDSVEGVSPTTTIPTSDLVVAAVAASHSTSSEDSTNDESTVNTPTLTLGKLWVQPGDQLQVGTQGLAPQSNVRISIRSEVVELGEFIADASGIAFMDVTIPTSFADDPGLHTIVATGIDELGQQVEVMQQIRVGFDSRAPWIEPIGSAGAISLSADTVDVTAEGQVITMTSAVFDDLSGFDSGSIQWRGPNDTIFSCIATRIFLYGGGACVISAGDDLNGLYSSPIVLPSSSRPGAYEFISLGLRDKAGNQVNYVDPIHSEVTPGSVDMTTLGYRPGAFDFTVTSSGIIDFAPPTISPFGSNGAMTLSARNVDTSSSSKTIAAELQVQDDLSGFSRGGINWSNGDRSIATCISDQTFLFGGGECKRTSGDEFDGLYSSPVNFPANSRAGVYRFTSMTLIDNSGNQATYFDPANVQTSDSRWVDITTLGYSSGAFDITSTGTGDLIAPWIAAFGSPGAISLSTNSVNSSTGAQTVTLSLGVSDDLSGFESGTIQWTNGDITLFSCVAEQIYFYGGGACTRTSGDGISGNYSSPVRLPANGKAGIYRFMSLTLDDKSGNRVTYYDPANAPACGANCVDITTLGYRSGFLDISNGP